MSLFHESSGKEEEEEDEEEDEEEVSQYLTYLSRSVSPTHTGEKIYIQEISEATRVSDGTTGKRSRTGEEK